MNVFVCCVKLYLEVGSRDYLVTSDDALVFYLEIGLETPPQRTETREKCSSKIHFELGLDL